MVDCLAGRKTGDEQVRIVVETFGQVDHVLNVPFRTEVRQDPRWGSGAGP